MNLVHVSVLEDKLYKLLDEKRCFGRNLVFTVKNFSSSLYHYIVCILAKVDSII